MSQRNTLAGKGARRHERAARDQAQAQQRLDEIHARARYDQLADVGAAWYLVNGLMVAGPLGPLVPRWTQPTLKEITDGQHH